MLLIEGGSDKRSRYVMGGRIDCHPLVLGKLKEHFLNNGVLELVHAFHYMHLIPCIYQKALEAYSYFLKCAVES